MSRANRKQNRAQGKPRTGDDGTLPSLAPRRSWAIRINVAAAVAAAAAMIGAFVLLGACDSGGGTLPTNPIEATEDSIATGARLYQGNCLICHGTDGRGSPLAPDLTVHVLTRKDGFLFERISRGFPADSELKTMPSFGSVFSEMERWHLVNFLRETFKGDFVAP